MIVSTLKYEQEFWKQKYDVIIGIDEVGRGPLAGPVVAAACALKSSSPFGRGCPVPGTGEGSELNSQNYINYSVLQNTLIRPSATLPRRQAGFSHREKGNSKSFELIRDSKVLSEKQRESLYDFIHEHFHVGVGICDHGTIDRINILEASFLAMKKALSNLMKDKKGFNRSIILVDGNKLIPNLSMEQRAIVSGDKLVKSISAASIIAKVTRDRMMVKMNEKYPQYCFNEHKGYGTKLHMDRIREFGVCEIHRKSFKPCR